MKIEKDLSEIRQVYANADKAGKTLMEQLYGPTVLLQVTNVVTSFETACTYLKLPIEKAKRGFNEMSEDEIAYRKLKTITAALNEGWTPDLSDEDQKKWFPWFDFQAGRFGLQRRGLLLRRFVPRFPPLLPHA